MPGFVTRVRLPLRTSASICSDDWDIIASVKSSVTWPLVTRISIRCGTTHRPLRRTFPLRQSMRATSFGFGERRVCLRARSNGQVGGKRGKFATAADGKGNLQPPVEFFRGEPAVAGGVP